MSNKAALLNKPKVGLSGSKGSALLKRAKTPRLKPLPDPLGEVEYTDNIEADAQAEFEALEKTFTADELKFKEDAKRERLAWINAIDSEFWLDLCFRSRAQKDAFLRGLQQKYGISLPGDKYVDGEVIAAALGIELPSEEPSLRTPRGVDPKLAELAM